MYEKSTEVPDGLVGGKFIHPCNNIRMKVVEMNKHSCKNCFTFSKFIIIFHVLKFSFPGAFTRNEILFKIQLN